MQKRASEPSGDGSPDVFVLHPARARARASEGKKRFYGSTICCAAGVSSNDLVIITVGPFLIIKICLKEAGST